MEHIRIKKTEEKVFSFIREQQMLAPGDSVVAGVSGGADSVCLLFVLCEWRRRYGLELAVVHVDHGIRPEAGADASFVEQLCRQLEVPFLLREADIPALAAESGCTEEEAGRNFRYRAFAEAAEKLAGKSAFSAETDAKEKSSASMVKIAVAHNLNDQSETMLFHLFRGSGIRGLAGIAPVRDNIIRPLLCLERDEIEAYLAEKGQACCRDATNEEDDHTRNRIRHHILPYAEQEIAPGCVRHMGRTAQMLSETEDYLEQQTKKALKECGITVSDKSDSGNKTTDMSYCTMSCHTTVSYTIDREKFLSFHPVIRKRMLLELAKRLSPGAKDISYTHVTDLYSLFMEEGNREICLPFGIRGRREYARVILERLSQKDMAREKGMARKEAIAREKGMAQEKTMVQGSGEEQVLEDALSGISVVSEVLSVDKLPRNEENLWIFPQNHCVKWFDYDKIIKSPVLRTRKQGDYLMITDGEGNLHRKSLQDYMVTEKIPAGERDRIPLLAVDDHILWIVGYRISAYYKMDGNTKQVLQVQLITDREGDGADSREHGLTGE